MSCIQLEDKRPLTKEEKAKGWERRPYYGYDPEKMCAVCAAGWYVELAAQRLETAKRTGSRHGL